MAIKRKISTPKKELTEEERERQSRSSGALFLVISFAAFLSVCILLFIRFYHFNEGEENMVSLRPAGEASSSDFALREKMLGKSDSEVDQSGLSYVVPSINAVKGRWVALFGTVRVEIMFFGNEYQVLVQPSLQDALVKYSRGRYQYDTEIGKMTLIPNSELEPIERESVSYKVLTTNIFDLYIGVYEEQEQSLFFMPTPSGVKLPTNLIHPLFLYKNIKGEESIEFTPKVVEK